MASVEEGLGELVAHGPRHVRLVRRPALADRADLAAQGRGRLAAGRWSLFDRGAPLPPAQAAEFVARGSSSRRTGVVFRKTLAREKLPVPWRDVARACRTLEARGEIRGGRFVAGFDGEQYALPEAVTLLRAVRRRGERPLGSGPLSVSAATRSTSAGILTPEPRVAASGGLRVAVG